MSLPSALEAWFIASIESVRSKLGIDRDVAVPPEPESVRGAKEWLSEKIGRRYSETLDQPALAAIFDLDLARRAPSFDKFVREVRILFMIAPAS